MKKENLKDILKSIGTVTLETIPDIMEFIPVFGGVLGKALSKTMDAFSEYGDIKNEQDILNTIEEVKKAIDNKQIEEEKVIKAIRSEAIDYIRQKTERVSAYMFGVVIYTFYSDEMDAQDAQFIEELLSQENSWEPDEVQEYADGISEFCKKYNGGEMFVKDKDFYINDNSVVINFYCEYENYKRNEADIIDVIDYLNEFLGKKLFLEYTIF